MAVRRRIRGKRAIRSMMQSKEEGESEEKEVQFRREVEKLVRSEVEMMIHDDPEMVKEEAEVLASLRKMAIPPADQDEEVLQTRIVSQAEVIAHWPQWKEAVEAEVRALLEEKEALKEIGKEELQDLVRKAAASGRKVEFVPSKMVFTKKPGPKGGKAKARWVVCGNFEAPKEGEQNYSGGADAAACRLLVATASYYQWEGGTLDVKTAFLNAEMFQTEEEDILVVKAPGLLKDQKVVGSTSWFVPLRAVYGFRRSPRLWGKTRDIGLHEMEVVLSEGEKEVKLVLNQLISEPNLWRIEEEEEKGGSQPGKLRGLLMTYVDDMLVVGQDQVVSKTMEAIQLKWKTSTPDRVSSTPVKFLGVEISKHYNQEKKREEWLLTQESYTKDLLQREAQKLKVKKIPITRDQTSTPEGEKTVTAPKIKQAQKEVGELLWLVTRTRPDVMFAIARMSMMVLKWPDRVHEIYEQVLGYLLATSEQGILFSMSPEDPVTVEAYSDASFAPEGGASHGCFLVALQGSILFWRSGRQHLMSLSTAEAEMIEVVEAMIAGESIHVMVAEIFHDPMKRMWTESQSAIGILSSEGGSWRTRHLRLRSNAARESIIRGEWTLAHLRGEAMMADLGKKPLASNRLEKLKKDMGMCSKTQAPLPDQKGQAPLPDQDGQAPLPGQKKEEKGKEVDVTKAASVIRLITIAAAITAAKGEEEDEDEDESINLDVIAVVFAVIIVICTLGIQRIWKVGVQWFQRNITGRHPGEAAQPASEENRGDALEAVTEPTATLPRGGDALPTGGESAVVHPPGGVALQAVTEPTAMHPPQPPSNEHRGDALEAVTEPTATLPRGGDALPTGGESAAVHPPGGVALEAMTEPAATHPPEEGEEEEDPIFQADLLAAWDAIEREERQIWADMNRNPQLYGAEDQTEAVTQDMPDLPFRVFTTRYGQVYHVDRECGHLKSPQIREIRESSWCHLCQRVAISGRGRPPPGVNLWFCQWGTPVHTDPRCPRINRADEMRVCSSCVNRLH